MSRTVLKWCVYLLLFGGGLLICDGMWLRTKAVFAQVLLRNAWQETHTTGALVKPWPWADSWPVARLRVARLGVDHIVLAGTSGEVLAFGPGHQGNSSVPGRPGNCILAGHRDTSFAFLQQIERGDTVTIEAADGKRYDFQVTSMHVKQQDELYLAQMETPWLTLVTCYPFDDITPNSSLRYVVFARLTGTDLPLVSVKS